MAEDTTHVSSLLDVGSAGHRRRADAIRGELQAELHRAGEVPGFAMEPAPEYGEGVLWIHAEGDGKPEHVIAFVLRCAAAFNLVGRWGFRFAQGCSRPRLDAFGGGAVVLDLGAREIVASISLHHWLDRALAGAAGARPAGEARP